MIGNTGGSVADVIAFDSWTEEQKRIARAGVEVERIMAAHVSEARAEGYDAGLAAAQAVNDRDCAGAVRRAVERYENTIADAWVKLRLLIPQFTPGDSRLAHLREITAALGMEWPG